MSFRTVYGYRVSEAGWRMCDRNECDVMEPPPGADPKWLKAMIFRRGDAMTVMTAAAWYYHRNVEPLDLYRQGVGDDWGWSSTNDVPNSNHLAGVGGDFNAVQYPWGRRTMPADRVAKCEEMARLFEGFLFWGRWWGKVDEMHWQLGVPEFDPDGQPNRRLAAFAQKLREGHLGIFGPPDANAFPLPMASGAWGPSWYFGPLDGPEQSISNEWQPNPSHVAALKRFQAAGGIPATGVYDAATKQLGTALQVRNGWTVTGRIYAGEWDAVIRHGQKPDLSAEPIGMEYADVSQWQAPVRTGYPHPFFMFRANNGNDVDRNAAENLGWSVAMVNDGKEPLRGFGVYTFWRPGEDNLGTLKKIVGVPHPRMVVMIDVESAEGSTKGTVRGDQSAGVAAFVKGVQEWIGDPARVHLGYINAKINLGLWVTRPKDLYYVIPDYSAAKGQPRTVVDGWRIHQYTDKGRCAPWGDAPIDLNYFEGTPSEFLAMLGLDKAVVRPPATETPTAPGEVPFPLSPGYAYGPIDGPAHAISGKWRDDTEEQREGLRRYQAKLGLHPTGVWEAGSPVDLETRKLQAARGWKPEGPGWIYKGEWDVVMNGAYPVQNETAPTPVPSKPTTGAQTVTTKIKDLTGPNTSAAARGIGGTDLGIATKTPNGKVLYTFGDTFDQFTVGGPGWRSPVALKSELPSLADLNAGISFNDAVNNPALHPDPNYATQSLPYQHNVGGISTVLPTDVWTIREYMFMHVMVIGQGGLSDCRWTEMHYSLDNGERWTHAGAGGRREGGEFDSMFQMLTVEWDAATGWCYAYSARGLARNSGVYLWRFRDADSTVRANWEGWGWNGSNWGWGRYPSNIMPNGVTVGEMNLRKVQNNWVFTYFETNSGRIVSKVLSAPNANIGAAPTKVIVSNGPEFAQASNPGNIVSQPYGGYLIPGSTLAEPHYVISQWDTVGGDNWPYRSMQFKGSALTPVNPI